MPFLHSSAPPRRRRDAGFNLIEIVIVTVIIGLLAVLALPAIQKTRQASQNNRFVSDLRVFAQAFESYSVVNGGWPPNAGSGVTRPAGNAQELPGAVSLDSSPGKETLYLVHCPDSSEAPRCTSQGAGSRPLCPKGCSQVPFVIDKEP